MYSRPHSSGWNIDEKASPRVPSSLNLHWKRPVTWARILVQLICMPWTFILISELKDVGKQCLKGQKVQLELQRWAR